MSKVTTTPRSSTIEVGMTDFIKFVGKSGQAKQTVVSAVKTREPYETFRDYYLQLRNRIIHIHKHQKPKKELDQLLGEVHPDKVDNYREAIVGYKKFLGRKTVELISLPARIWPSGKMKIRVNPEICLVLDDAPPTIIKLYFNKDEKLTAANAKVSLELMAQVYRKELELGWSIALLDVRTGRPQYYKDSQDYLPLLEGEASSFEKIWMALDN
jgi:hypothetical protein